MLKKRKPKVALLVAPETSASVLYGLYDVLFSVGAVYDDMTIGLPAEGLLDVVIVAAERVPFRVAGNIMIEPHAALAELEAADVVIVCDLYTPIDAAPRGRYVREVDWLRKVHAAGAVIASVCSGSLVLADAGLLDGRQCACHWAYRALFREYYPKVEFREESILNLTSEAEGVITAASVTAWQDLVLHIIGRLCGPERALETAKVFLLAGHEDGQLPFAAMTRRIQKQDAVIAKCQEWIAQNYASATPVAAMAERSGLSPRTFARRFRAATGYLPMEYVHAMRIEEAKQIIETEPTALDDIAERVGYEDPASFRRLFKRKTGLSPAAYRKKFAHILDISLRAPVAAVAAG